VNSLLGQSLVLAGLVAAAFGAVVGLVAGGRQSQRALRLAQAAAYVFSAAMVLANLVMIRALVTHDFSVSYVAHVGSRATPVLFTVVSLWSSLDGSILFWGAILGVYVAAFTYFNRDRYREYMGYALGTILAIGTFFAFLLAGPAHPFSPVFPVPADGPGPNPLLQNHILMVVHPPTLYLGYVGMTIPFGIAVAALLRGRLSEGWLKPLRRWTLIPWAFLSVGIVMGGWWAYEVLGWGGYWAWDPVENASFLPWLAATGYLHSSVVQERKRILKAWTLSLVLGAFLLTVLGTFMTRSGVFNSVHSFTQSPIGPVFLVFLAVVLVVSIGLVAARGHMLEPEGRIDAVASRESAFLLNNLVFVIFTFTVLLGTIFPLLSEAVRGVKLSVGEPYFDRMAIPIGLLLVFLMGVGPVLPWGKANLGKVLTDFVLPVLAGLVVVGVALALGMRAPLAVATFGLVGFAGIVTAREMVLPVLERMRRRQESLGRALAGSLAAHRRRYGGYVVHLAVLIIVASVAASQTYKQTAEASLAPGQSFTVGDYTLNFERTEAFDEPHRFAVGARVNVEKAGRLVGVLEPRLNFYPTQREPVGTPDVRTIGYTDVYLSLMSFEQDGSRVAVKAFIVPMVAWIWWSLPIIALGALMALWPRRRARVQIPTGAEVSRA